jgi:hypothetical protein
MVNPDRVTATESTPTSFSIILDSVNSTTDLSVTNPGSQAFGTALNFTGPTGCDLFMNRSWQIAVNKVTTSQTFEYLDFYSQSYIMDRRILIHP